MNSPTAISPTTPTGARPALAVFMLVVASCAWGLTWIPLKHFGGFGLNGLHVAAVAHGTLSLLALPFLLIRRGNWWHARGTMLGIALAGGLANVAFSSAILYGNVLRVMALFYLLPVWGVFGGALLLRERVDNRRKASVVLALLGAFLVLGGFTVFHQLPNWVDAVALLSGMALALNNIIFHKAEEVPVTQKVAFTFIGSCGWATFALVALQLPAPVDLAALVWMQVAAFGLAYLLPASIGTLWSVTQMEAGRSSVLIIVELLVAVASAAWYSRQLPTQTELAGGLLIVLAAVLESRPRLADD